MDNTKLSWKMAARLQPLSNSGIMAKEIIYRNCNWDNDKPGSSGIDRHGPSQQNHDGLFFLR